MADSGSDDVGKVTYLFILVLLVVVVALVAPDMLVHNIIVKLVVILLALATIVSWIVSPLLDSAYSDKRFRKHVAKGEYKVMRSYDGTARPLEEYSIQEVWASTTSESKDD